MAIIGVGIYSIEAGGCNVFDSHARDMFYNSHSERTCVLLEMLSMHKLVNIFRLYMGMRIYMNLKVYKVATFEPHLFSSNVEHCSI